LPLKIIISGAGLGGLATAIALARRGHQVTAFEQVEKLSEVCFSNSIRDLDLTIFQVGAGIQIPSNSSRLLLRWGVDHFLEGKVVEPENISFRRWKSGEVIGYTKLVPDFREIFDAPYYVVHRAHFHDALYRRAVELGVIVRTGAKVVDYDLDAPSITLEDGSKHLADLVVAAEGRCVTTV
jgi:salicylate hydroxylase